MPANAQPSHISSFARTRSNYACPCVTEDASTGQGSKGLCIQDGPKKLLKLAQTNSSGSEASCTFAQYALETCPSYPRQSSRTRRQCLCFVTRAPHYFPNLIATPRADGREVYLSNHLPTVETLSVRNWLTGAAEFYPDDDIVDFERMERRDADEP